MAAYGPLMLLVDNPRRFLLRRDCHLPVSNSLRHRRSFPTRASSNRLVVLWDWLSLPTDGKSECSPWVSFGSFHSAVLRARWRKFHLKRLRSHGLPMRLKSPGPPAIPTRKISSRPISALALRVASRLYPAAKRTRFTRRTAVTWLLC